MKRISILLITLSALLLVSCGGGEAKKNEYGGNASLIKELNVNSPDTDQYLLVKTIHGDFLILMYRETPGHRKNFVYLVFNGFYDGQLIYRVKKDLLIQTGD